MDGKEEEILDEEVYTKALESIIERTYFPDLARLAATRELMEAEETRDPIKIERAKENLSRVGVEAESLRGLSVDEFLMRYTSEDNASLRTLLESDMRRKRREKSWMQGKKESKLEDEVEGMNGKLLEWVKESGHNALMFAASGVKPPLSITYPGGSVPASINPKATRLPEPIETGKEGASISAGDGLTKQFDLRDAALVTQDALEKHLEGRVEEFSSGTGMGSGMGSGGTTPMMTWGEISATPRRIEPSFCPPNVTSRERVEREMLKKAARKRSKSSGATPSIRRSPYVRHQTPRMLAAVAGRTPQTPLVSRGRRSPTSDLRQAYRSPMIHDMHTPRAVPRKDNI
eukprot:TRINITY_DN2220_c0_g3_i1.p1 TRINITY_DN2220_c0_g3~~TRINITY_DN2220_c0_g3_i1.p1  ORF type:complete len:346 (+),score=113.01 TRINITY_DN2220_c0_g3_i1:303-1340(+)